MTFRGPLQAYAFYDIIPFSVRNFLEQEHELESFSPWLCRDGYTAQPHQGAYDTTGLVPVLCLYLHQCSCVQEKA